MNRVLLLMLIYSLNACSKTTISNSENMKSNASFDNTRWKLTGLASLKALPQLEKDVFVRFDKEKSRTSGNAGCNNFTGTYQLSDNSLKIGPVASTKMMCQPQQMEVENAFLKALQEADHFKVAGDKLQLLHGEKLLAEFKALYLE